MKGDEPWLSALSGPQVSPIVVAAPVAGRFAVSRTLVSANAFDLESLTTEDLTAQEITVMQNHDGRQLLKVQASPIQRAGQNFDLSPDGLHFAVVRNGNIEVYSLPALTNADKKALEEARKMEPERNDAPVRLKPGMTIPASVADASEEAAPTAAGKNAPAPAASPAKAAVSDMTALPGSEGSQSAAAASGATAVGQVTSSEGQLGDTEGASRKRPSLYSSEYPKGDSDGGQAAKPQ
jgi:hypothetical protein